MKEIEKHELFYQEWTPSFKEEAARRYRYIQKNYPGIIEQVLTDNDRWLLDDYLLSDEKPSQEEMSKRTGWSRQWINVGSRYALGKLELALKGDWPPPPRSITPDIPEILPQGPGFGKNGKRTGKVELSAEDWQELNHWREIFSNNKKKEDLES